MLGDADSQPLERVHLPDGQSGDSSVFESGSLSQTLLVESIPAGHSNYMPRKYRHPGMAGKMQPGSDLTARNLCAADFCAEYSTATIGDFNWYWDTLDRETKLVYRKRAKEERAACRRAFKSPHMRHVKT